MRSSAEHEPLRAAQLVLDGVQNAVECPKGHVGTSVQMDQSRGRLRLVEVEVEKRFGERLLNESLRFRNVLLGVEKGGEPCVPEVALEACEIDVEL